MERLAAFRDYERDQLHEVGFRQEGAPELIEQSETYTIRRVRHLRGQLSITHLRCGKNVKPGPLSSGTQRVSLHSHSTIGVGERLDLGITGKARGAPRIFCPQFPNAVPAIWVSRLSPG